MLPAIEQARRRGDLDGGAVAMLTDRIEVKAGHGQIYGTQLSLKGGRWVLTSPRYRRQPPRSILWPRGLRDDRPAARSQPRC
jgi:hypothetical protein